MFAATVDLLQFGETPQTSTLDLVRLNHAEIAVLPFTAEGKQVHFHYREEADIRGYNLCNGPGCLLCRIGHKPDKRVLLPIYLPAAQTVGILPVPTSMTPFSLMPQIVKALKSDRRSVLFIRREGSKYHVQQTALTPEAEGGEAVISDFLERYSNGEVDLTAVYNRVDNETLAQVPEIARMMALKGIRLDADLG